jgi:hypothetical protein
MESYSDYPQGVKNNAKKGIELNEKINNRCATPVGKVRAQQLAKGEPISLETIKRMHSYLSRAEAQYRKNEGDNKACSVVSYLLWGGLQALSWSRNKLRELGELEENEISIPNSSYPGESNESISGSINLEDDARKILFPTQEMAEEYAEIIGCSGSHPHETDQGTYFMSCKTHPTD